MAPAMISDMVWVLSGFLLGLTLLLVLVVAHYREKVATLTRDLQESTTRKRSLATTYGRITEQFAPFMAAYPFDPKDFRFIGSPIDGIQFTPDAIYVIEMKAAGGRVTKEQARIRELVENGQVYWHEFRVSEAPRER